MNDGTPSLHPGRYFSRVLRRAIDDTLPSATKHDATVGVVQFAIALAIVSVIQSDRSQAGEELRWGLAIGIAFVIVLIGRFLWNLVLTPARLQLEADTRACIAKDERDAALGRTEPMPEGFVSVRHAVARLLELRNAKNVGDAMQVDLAADALRDAANQGVLVIWGLPKNSPRYEPIQKDYWASAKIDSMDLMADDGTPGRTEQFMYATGYRSYSGLCAAFDALDHVWPEMRGTASQSSDS